jgi:hypothetical protein
MKIEAEPRTSLIGWLMPRTTVVPSVGSNVAEPVSPIDTAAGTRPGTVTCLPASRMRTRTSTRGESAGS